MHREACKGCAFSVVCVEHGIFPGWSTIPAALAEYARAMVPFSMNMISPRDTHSYRLILSAVTVYMERFVLERARCLCQ